MHALFMSAQYRHQTHQVTVWRYRRAPFRMPDAHTPAATLVGHEQAVGGVAVDAGLDTVVSISHDVCLVHKLNGDLVRVIRHDRLRRPHLVAIATVPRRIVVFYRYCVFL